MKYVRELAILSWGINLKTETPKPAQIKEAVDEVIIAPAYKDNVRRIGKEFSAYNAKALTALYVEELIGSRKIEVEPDVREVFY